MAVREKDIEVRGVLTGLYKNCPKPWGWFGGFLRTSKYGTIHVTGSCAVQVYQGISLVCTGNLVDDRGYLLLEATNVRPDVNSVVGIRKFLSSSLFKGIGTATIDKLLQNFGEDTLTMIEHNSDVVEQTCHLSKKQMRTLIDGVCASSLKTRLVQRYPHMTMGIVDIIVNWNIFRTHSFDSIEKSYNKNPYELFWRKYPVKFSEIDKIALNDVPLAWDDSMRVDAVFAKSMQDYMRQTGGTYLNLSDYQDVEKFRSIFMKLLGHPYSPAELSNLFRTLIQGNKLVYKEVMNGETHLYDYGMYGYETDIRNTVRYYRKILAWKDTQSVLKSRQQAGKVYVTQARKYGGPGGMVFHKEQEEAIEHVMSNPFSCLTGGPGRGKTTVLAGLVDAWKKATNSNNVFMLAPTGRAVNRIKSATGETNVETIARFLLSHGKYLKEHCDNHGNLFVPKIMTADDMMPRTFDTLVIVDEASMVCFADAARLLKYIEGCWVVFVGDKDQLPPIEAGPFFYSFLNSKVIPTYKLETNHRSHAPEIVSNADEMILGKEPSILTKNFELIPAPDVDMVQYAVTEYQNALKNGAELSDVLVMSPINKYVGGVVDMNLRLQDALNPLGKGIVSVNTDMDGYVFESSAMRSYFDAQGMELTDVQINGQKLRIGDRVMNTVNHPEKSSVVFPKNDLRKEPDSGMDGCYNGDSGQIIRYYPVDGRERATLVVRLDDGRVIGVDTETFRSEWVLAYCVSVHKAQGSEAKHCIVLYPSALAGDGWFMTSGFLNRNLVYTAITRAQDDVHIIGALKGFTNCIRTEYKYHNTVLDDKLMTDYLQDTYAARKES